MSKTNPTAPQHRPGVCARKATPWTPRRRGGRILQAENYDYDAIVSKLMLPKMDGGNFETPPQNKKTPVLMLTRAATRPATA